MLSYKMISLLSLMALGATALSGHPFPNSTTVAAPASPVPTTTVSGSSPSVPTSLGNLSSDALGSAILSAILLPTPATTMMTLTSTVLPAVSSTASNMTLSNSNVTHPHEDWAHYTPRCINQPATADMCSRLYSFYCNEVGQLITSAPDWTQCGRYGRCYCEYILSPFPVPASGKRQLGERA